MIGNHSGIGRLHGRVLAVLAAAFVLQAAPAVMSFAIAAPATAKQQAVAASDGETAKKININTATQDLLATLPGVGPALAKRIVDYRERNGEFKRIEELMNVKGIGEKSFEKIRPHITVKS